MSFGFFWYVCPVLYLFTYLLFIISCFLNWEGEQRCGVGWMGTDAGYWETFMNIASLASILLIQYHLWISVALFKGSFDFVYYTLGWWNRILFIVWEYFTSCLTSIRIVIKTLLYGVMGFHHLLKWFRVLCIFVCLCIITGMKFSLDSVFSLSLCLYRES